MMPYPSMITNVPSIAARISGMPSTSRIRNRSASLMAAQSADGVSGADRASAWGSLRATRPCSFMSACPPRERRDRRDEPRHAVGEPRGGPRRGPVAKESGEQAVAWEEGLITYVGPADGLAGVEPEWFEGCTIAPGFVDCHTHLPFAGWRADEFEARLSGLSYRDLHGGGRGAQGGGEGEGGSVGPPREGGIYRSARMLAEASDDEVLAFCRSLVQGWPSTARRHSSSRPGTGSRSRPSSDRPASPGSSRGGAADVFGHAARVSRRARRDGARRLGPRRLR